MNGHLLHHEAASFTEKEWKRFLRILADLSGVGLSFYDDEWRRIAETPVVSPICRLLHRSEEGKQLCREHCQTAIFAKNSSAVQAFTCPGQMALLAAKVRVSNRLAGYLIGGGIRIEGKRQSVDAEKKLEQLANQVGISVEKLVAAYRASRGVSTSNLKRRLKAFNRLLGALSEMVGEAWLARATNQVRSCGKRSTTQELWPTTVESVKLLVPAENVEIFTIAPAQDSVTAVWPKGSSRPPLDHGDLKRTGKRGLFTNERGETLVLLRHDDAVLAVLRIRCAGVNRLTKEELARLRKVGDAAAGALASIIAHATKQRLDGLECRLNSTRDHYDRLQVVLENCAKLLECDAADVSLAAPDRPWLLRLARRYGEGSENLPNLYRADIGINKRVIETKMTAVALCTSQDPGLQIVTSATSRVGTRHDETDSCKDQRLLATIRACVKFPLKAGGGILGVMSLYRRNEGDFDLIAIRSAEALAVRASVDAAAVQACEDLSHRLTQVREDVLPPQNSTSRPAGLSATHAVQKLCQELANRAMIESGAFRAAVRLVSPDRRTIGVGALAAQNAESWPASFEQNPVPLEMDCAATYAVKTGETYVLPDTGEKTIHYIAVGPKPAGSHASVILRSGLQTLGVLSLDWIIPHGFNKDLIESLQALAQRYTAAIRSFGMDELFWKIDDFLKPHNKMPSVTNYGGFLRAVADLVRANQGALFIRRPDTGRYHLVAHLSHPEWSGEDHWYESGEGLTGWIAAHNRHLRIANIADRTELRAVAEDLIWRDKVFDGPTKDKTVMSYLGVPVAVGNEVLGVLRFAVASDRWFSTNDQQIAIAAASKLAVYLYGQAEARRKQAFLILAESAARTRSQSDLAQLVYQTLSTGVGNCACHMRLLDKLQRLDGEVISVLRLLTTSHPEWQKMAPVRLKGEGIAGRAWSEKRSIVYGDVEKHGWIRDAVQEDLRTDNLHGKVGSGACACLNGDDGFMGTLHVHKYYPNALSPSEVAFLEEVARFTGTALQMLGKKEEDTLRVKLASVVDDFVMNLLERPNVRQEEASLLTKVLGVLQEVFQASAAWVRLPDDLRTQFRVVHAHGIHQREVPDIGIEETRNKLGEKGFFVVSDCQADSRIRTFLAGQGGTYQELVQEAYGCAILLAVDRAPIALFSLLMQPPYQISYTMTERAVELLRPVAETVLLARRYEQHEKDLEVSRPFTLLGSLFSRLEHEVRAPVSKLKGAIEFLTERPRTGEEIQRMLGLMKEDREKLQSCLWQMICLVGLSRTPFAPVDLTSSLTKVVEGLAQEARGPKLAFDPPVNRLTVKGIAEYLESAFQFVIKNAIEAAATKGPAGSVRVMIDRTSEHFCTVVVEDNGLGMAHGAQQRAFEPFYTTKTTGTGLGLPAAYCIVRSHGGQLALDSQEGSGTRATITLPMAREGI